MPASAVIRAPSSDRVAAEDRRRADQEPLDRLDRVVLRRPWRTGRAGRTSPRSAGAAWPAGRARTYRNAGAPGPRVEVLVRAADGQVGPGDSAAAPAPSRPSGTGPTASSAPTACAAAVIAGQVGDRAGPVGHVRQADQGDVARPGRPRRAPVDARRRCRSSTTRSSGPRACGQPRQHVPVGGEVVVVGDDDAAGRAARPAPRRPACTG